MPNPVGRPRKTVESVQEVHASHEFDSSVRRFLQGVRKILGAGVHTHLAAIRMKPARLAELAVGRPRMLPLRWSSLSDAQKKEMDDLIPYRGVDDLVMYGDTCVVICPEEEWMAEQHRKAREAREREAQTLSPAALSRDAGIPIDTAWEDLGEGHAPQLPRG